MSLSIPIRGFSMIMRSTHNMVMNTAFSGKFESVAPQGKKDYRGNLVSGCTLESCGTAKNQSSKKELVSVSGRKNLANNRSVTFFQLGQEPNVFPDEILRAAEENKSLSNAL